MSAAEHPALTAFVGKLSDDNKKTQMPRPTEKAKYKEHDANYLKHRNIENKSHSH